MSDIQNRLLDKFLSRQANMVSASIHDFEQVSPTLYRVIATFSSRDWEAEKMGQALASCLGNEFSPVPGSFREVTAGVPAAIGFVRANREVRELTAAVEGQMKVMAKNILMDKSDDSLWEVRSNGDSRYLIRQTAGDDLGKVMQTAKVRAYNVPKLAVMATASLSRREIIAYVNYQTEEVHLAGVLASVDGEDGEQLEVLDENGETQVVDPNAVVESAHLKGEIEAIAAEKGVDLPANLNSKEGMISYYNTLFQYAPDYAKQLREIIDQRAVI